MIVGLLVTQSAAFYEAVFFVGLITFLNTYMLMLIRELDDPFDYRPQKGVDEVSLLPLIETEQRISSVIKQLESGESAQPVERAKVQAEAQA